MKDNLNIEKLFKDKFENFEGNVNPDLWTNISNGISSNAAVSSSIGLGVKAIIIGVSAITVGVTAYFVGDFNQPIDQIVDHTVKIEIPVSVDQIIADQNSEDKSTETINIIADDNDPIITENKEEIIKELSNAEVVKTSGVTTETITNNVSDGSKSFTEQHKTIETESKTTVLETSEEDNTPEANSVETVESSANNTIADDIAEQLIPTGKIESFSTENIFEYKFRSNGKNVEQITWNFGDGNLSFDANPNHVYTHVGVYQIELLIVGENDLSYKEVETIEIISTAKIDNIPNVFTPNGDRVNDEFLIVETSEINEFMITIKNRQGKTVFQSNDQNFIWDGTDMSGNRCEKAIYTYYIIAKGYDGGVLKIPGQLSLVR